MPARMIEEERKRYDAPALDKHGTEIRARNRVRIPKGTLFHSTRPRVEGIQMRLQTTTVKVVAIDRNTTGKHEICWVGTGSYWFYCLVEDVEKVV